MDRGRCLRVPARALLAALVAVGATGCGATHNAESGECNARVRYDGALYESRDELTDPPDPGRELGQGVVADCDGTTVPAMGTVRVSELRRVDPTLAVGVRGGIDDEMRGIYVRRGVADSQLPGRLRLR